MNDDRKFRCDPSDAEKVVAKFQNAKTPRPLNFAHGKDPVKGQKAAGRLVECIRTAEDGIGYSSTASRGNDTGSAVYNTHDLRLLEASSSGTKAVSLKASDALLADRAIVVPGDPPVANGFVRTDPSGNWFYSGYCAFAAYRSADQTGILPDTQTKVDLDTEEFDQGGCFDTASKRFTALSAGKYLFTAAVGMIPDALETLLRVSLRVNGTEKRVAAIQGSLSSRGLVASVTAVLDLAMSDYVEVYVLHTKSGIGTVLSSASVTYFNGTRVG
jgi:hypothetical protein